mmetsp:Transcript_40562/g.108828  ORF Transcript_40562/g.108828 Transcript_40562/m.108828 type:complete len:215 (+) Transcript_40562:61-705(+)
MGAIISGASLAAQDDDCHDLSSIEAGTRDSHRHNDKDYQLGPFSDRVLSEVFSRGTWLVALLTLQSASSLVLVYFEKVVREHIVLTLFLTMLVGAGGNAGAQSAVKMIRDLSNGKPVRWSRVLPFQVWVGGWLALALGAAAWSRVWLFHGGLLNSTAIGLSCSIIVFSSVLVGSGLPVLLARLGCDPVHAGAAVQVLMDVWGVAVSCSVCRHLL